MSVFEAILLMLTFGSLIAFIVSDRRKRKQTALLRQRVNAVYLIW
ncbi:MAG: putative holin-like toxin [Peptococcaceae bacterium]|nr:putative holin-like toxin [Peptococcaceae bacterium]